MQSTRGARLVLHRLPPSGRPAPGGCTQSVLLAHGTFSNHRTCGGLARHLAAHGHDCWLLDYEGHGHSSSITSPAPDFETLFLSGTAVAIRHVVRTTGQTVHWIGHSGGGLAALMSMVREPDLIDDFRSLVMLGSQANDAAISLPHRVALRLAIPATALLGQVPGKLLKLGPENETAAVMQQWFKWNLRARWRSADGLDYQHALSQLNAMHALPILTFAGSGDRFIAPPSACRKLHEILPSRDKYWLECGTRTGYCEDYTHARLISSRSAAREIWPVIVRWLCQNPPELRDSIER